MRTQQTIRWRTIAKFAPRMLAHPRFARHFIAVQTSRWWRARRPARDGRAGSIRQLSLSLTDDCTLRCPSCAKWGLSGRMHAHVRRSASLPAERYVALIEDLMRHGHHPSVYLWGGEPMLYDGVLDIIARAAALHLPVSVATNGHAVAARAAQIVGAPLFLLQVSIDGHCAELHDRLRPARDGRSNFTEACAALDAVRAARACAGTHLPITAGLVTITNANSGHLVDIYEAFRDRVDLFVFYLAWWIDAAHAAAHEHAFARRFGTIPVCHRGFMAVERPTAPAQLAAQFQALRQQSRARRAPAVMVIPPLTAAGDLERYYSDHGYRFGFARCPAIHQAAEVSSNGDLVTCRDYSDYVVGNVGTATITELWNSKRFMAFRRSIARDGLMPACSRCCGLMGY